MNKRIVVKRNVQSVTLGVIIVLWAWIKGGGV